MVFRDISALFLHFVIWSLISVGQCFFVTSLCCAQELTTIDGKVMKGHLVGVDSEGVRFRQGDVEVNVPAKEIRLVDFGNAVRSASEAKYDEIELTDGSLLRCKQFSIPGKKVAVTLAAEDSPSLPRIELPLTAVFSILRNAHDAATRDEWNRMLATRGKRDLYVIRTAEGMNFLPGTLIEGNEVGDVVTFEKEDGERTPLRLSRATGGLVFNQPPQANRPPTLCKVLDIYGNVLYAATIRFEGSTVQILTVSGATFTYPSTQGLAKLDYAQGNILYLSDLQPEVDAPEADPFEPRLTWMRDKNQLHDPLRLNGQSFAKGLWVAADTILTFPIGGDYREFKAIVGADETITNGSTAMRLTIEGDGRILFRDVIKRTEKPKPLNLNVKGMKTLRIIVEADAPYNGNQLVLAEARVQK